MIDPDKLFGRLGNRMFKEAYLYSQVRDGWIPDEYVQSEDYFINHAEEIKQLYGQDISHIDQVAIHVRRGDYVKNSFYVDLMRTDYYERAMAEFPDASFLVFSDNIEWCKQQKIFSKCDFAEGNDEVTDMNLMASCTGHIIANSSFSWWGSWLSPHGGKVVAPKEWYTDGKERTVCPSNWKII